MAKLIKTEYMHGGEVQWRQHTSECLGGVDMDFTVFLPPKQVRSASTRL